MGSGRRAVLVVMVKEPHPGRVKTRLGKSIGHTRAAWWFRHQTRSLLRRIEDPRWETVLAVSPDVEGLSSRVWPAHLPRVPQGHGDLGDRMGRLFREMPGGPMCIVGADIPGINRPAIAQAFQALGDSQSVFGPAPDGGYWLVGFKRVCALPPTLFHGVRWSTEHALADTRASIPGMTTSLIRELKDVDEVGDL